jgi:hypothetical protein
VQGSVFGLPGPAAGIETLLSEFAARRAVPDADSGSFGVAA